MFNSPSTKLIVRVLRVLPAAFFVRKYFYLCLLKIWWKSRTRAYAQISIFFHLVISIFQFQNLLLVKPQPVMTQVSLVATTSPWVGRCTDRIYSLNATLVTSCPRQIFDPFIAPEKSWIEWCSLVAHEVPLTLEISLTRMTCGRQQGKRHASRATSIEWLCSQWD